MRKHQRGFHSRHTQPVVSLAVIEISFGHLAANLFFLSILTTRIYFVPRVETRISLILKFSISHSSIERNSSIKASCYFENPSLSKTIWIIFLTYYQRNKEVYKTIFSRKIQIYMYFVTYNIFCIFSKKKLIF